jgi:DnaJ-class molecular chaperone
MTNYYEILGVTKDASEADIKKSYKKLAQKYHPDRYKGEDAGTKFQEISNAYKTLSDADDRAEYDNPQPEGYTFRTSNMGGPGGMEDIVRQMAEEMMNRGGGFNRQQRYPIANVSITLEEAFTGTTRTLNNNSFSIPAGVRSGNQLFVNGFIIIVNVTSHRKFRRSHDDLLTAVQISAVEAMVGIECHLKNIDGKTIKVKIPAGIQHGKLVRAAGMGMPNPEIDTRGDLLVQVVISIPDDLTNEEIESIMKVKHRKTFDA